MGPRVTVWNEHRQEVSDEAVKKVYPDGISAAVAEGLRANGVEEVRTAHLDEPGQGVPDEVLAETDVLFWWGHVAHDEVSEETVQRVHKRVLQGMGLVVLHSGHYSKIFKRVLGTSGDLGGVREEGEVETLWVTAPGHPIAAGIDGSIRIEHEEMYGEYFDVPEPETTVFVSWFAGGEVFRSGLCYTRGRGRVFYFRPGHETHPAYHQDEIRKVLANAARWAAPVR